MEPMELVEQGRRLGAALHARSSDRRPLPPGQATFAPLGRHLTPEAFVEGTANLGAV